MGRVRCISVEIRSRRQEGGSVMLEIGPPESTMLPLLANEWPIVLNALGHADMSQRRERRTGFPYVFGDFAFGE